MISKRAVQISVGDASVRGRVGRGCPQRGVISPLLWNLVLDSFLCRLNSEGFHTIAYADDLTMLNGKFEGVLCERMRGALWIIEDWCREHSLFVKKERQRELWR